MSSDTIDQLYRQKGLSKMYRGAVSSDLFIESTSSRVFKSVIKTAQKMRGDNK